MEWYMPAVVIMWFFTFIWVVFQTKAFTDTLLFRYWKGSAGDKFATVVTWAYLIGANVGLVVLLYTPNPQ